MGVPAFNSSTQKAGTDRHWTWGQLVYIVNFRPDRAKQWNPVSKKSQKQTKKKGKIVAILWTYFFVSDMQLLALNCDFILYRKSCLVSINRWILSKSHTTKACFPGALLLESRSLVSRLRGRDSKGVRKGKEKAAKEHSKQAEEHKEAYMNNGYFHILVTIS